MPGRLDEADADEVDAKIVAVTISGYAARLIATRLLRQPILAVSNDAMAARSFNLLPGVTGVHLDSSSRAPRPIISRAV